MLQKYETVYKDTVCGGQRRSRQKTHDGGEETNNNVVQGSTKRQDEQLNTN